MISEFYMEKIQNLGEWRILTFSEFYEKLHFTVGVRNGKKINISSKKKSFKYIFH